MSDSSTVPNAQNATLLEALRRLHAGDLTVQLPDSEGEVADLFNRHVQMVNTLASEVTYVVRDIGTSNRLGSQAEVPDAQGTWQAVITNINQMSENLTNQFRDLAHMTTQIAVGNLDTRSQTPMQGEFQELQLTINVMARQLQIFSDELQRLTREVGTEGKFGPQMEVRGTSGEWEKMVGSVNKMSANLTNQIRDLSYTTRDALQGGNRVLSCGAEGEMAELFERTGALMQRSK